MSGRWRSDHLPVAVMVGEGLLSRIGFSLMGFALPLYARQLGMSLADIGLLISLNAAVAMACKPAMGWAADRFGWRRSLFAGAALRSAVPLLLVFCHLPWQLFAVRAGHGVSMAVQEPAANTFLAVHGDRRNAVATAFAWYGTARNAGGAIGHAAAGILLSATAFDFSLVFLLACFCSLLPLLLIAGFLPDEAATVAPDTAATPATAAAPAAAATAEAPADDAPADKAPTIAAAAPGVTDSAAADRGARPPVLPVATFGLLVSGTAQMLHGLLPVLATEYAGLTPAETGIIYGFSSVVVLCAGPAFGWLSDHVSRRLVLLVRSAANVVSSGIFLAAPNLPGITLGTCVDNLGKAAFNPAWGAMLASVAAVDARRRSRTISLTSLGEDAGTIVGPILAGFLWNTWGVTTMLAVRLLLAVVAEVYALLLGRQVHATPVLETQSTTRR